MFQIIIFSFNRAMQLNALISSFIRYYCSNNYTIDVIYNTSNETFQLGYDKLATTLAKYENIKFHKEGKYKSKYSYREDINIYNLKMLIKYQYLRHPKTNFREMLIEIIKNDHSNEVMFLTDDSIFIKSFAITEDILKRIEIDPKHSQFSLRMGHKINDEPTNIIENISTNFIRWNLNEASRNTNWGYHFSVDGHIYNKNIILKLFNSHIFINPNSLEGYICAMARRKKLFNKGYAFNTSVLLSFPLNMVQNLANNEHLDISVEALNNYYLEGYEIEYPIPSNPLTFQQYPDTITIVNDNIKISLKAQ